MWTFTRNEDVTVNLKSEHIFIEFHLFLMSLPNPSLSASHKRFHQCVNHKKNLNLRHPLPTFGSFSFFQASILLGVDKVLQKLTKSYKNELRHLLSSLLLRYLFQKSPFIKACFLTFSIINIAWPWWWTLKKSELSVWKAWLIPSLWQWHWPIYRLLLSFKERWKNVKAKCLSSIQGNIILDHGYILNPVFVKSIVYMVISVRCG